MDTEPLQYTIAFSDSNFYTALGIIYQERCVGTNTLFGDRDVGSVMFWLTSVYDAVEAFKDILGDVQATMKA